MHRSFAEKSAVAPENFNDAVRGGKCRLGRERIVSLHTSSQNVYVYMYIFVCARAQGVCQVFGRGTRAAAKLTRPNDFREVNNIKTRYGKRAKGIAGTHWEKWE